MDNAHIQTCLCVIHNDLSSSGFGFCILPMNQAGRKTADFCNRFVSLFLRNGMNGTDINNTFDSGIPGQAHHIVRAMNIDVPDLRIVL